MRYASLNWTLPIVPALVAVLSSLGLLLLLLLIRFAVLINAFKRGRDDGAWLRPGVSASKIFPRRLERQAAFLTGRFAPHATRWQLII